jgi:hypothetical protein
MASDSAEAPLAVGQPVRVKQAGQWIDKWAEVLAVNPDGTFDVVVKPFIDSCTVSDEKGEYATSPDGERYKLDSRWYPLKNKPYPDEVVANEDEAAVAKYLKYQERDAFYQHLVDEEKRRNAPIEIMVVAHAETASRASFKAVTVDLTSMENVRDKMASSSLKEGGLGVDRNQKTTFFWHTSASREAMKHNFKVLTDAVGSRKLYLDGRALCEDPGNYHSWEHQRACIWAVDNNLPLVVLDPADEYDADKWGDVAHKHGEGAGCCVIV